MRFKKIHIYQIEKKVIKNNKQLFKIKLKLNNKYKNKLKNCESLYLK